MSVFEGIKAIVCDIEGTTTSIAFVHLVLFPYAKKHLGDFLRYPKGVDQEKQLLIDQALRQVAQITHTHDLESNIQTLEQWMQEDQKITPLKTLQGVLWEMAYCAGDFKGHVYDDAYRSLISWQNQGMSLFLYSSGSVKAQKLLFSFSDYGDLSGLFSDYFDTNIGGKKESQSYLKICEAIQEKYLTGIQANEILFISDIIDEILAAQQAQYQVAWSIREDNQIPLAQLSLYPLIPKIRQFQEITLN